MGKQKRRTPEQIIAKLREADVELGRGVAVGQICRKFEISEHTYYRWRKEYGGLTVDQAKRFKELELKNARLKKLVALASEYGRYGYRRITGPLRREGWRVNHKRVERIWRKRA